jgi:trans-aconitate 3-methyltransferase
MIALCYLAFHTKGTVLILGRRHRRATFSAAGYAAFRPSYPETLYRTILAFHQPPTPTGTLLDLGCGHGLISRTLSPHFGSLIAIDPSAGMIKQASESTKDTKISFRQGTAEDLSFLPDNSVDMVVAGQAAHWFKYDKAWPELARVVKRGGTLAFWGYKDNVVFGHPGVTEVAESFVYGKEEIAPGVESMERYWEQPGRGILRDSFRDIVPPETDWKEVKRIVYEPNRKTGTINDSDEGAWLRKRLTLGEWEGYLRTYSAANGWKDAHPEMKSRADGGEGDIVDLMFDEIVDSVPEWKAMGDKWRDVEFDSAWGTAAVLAKRQ